MQSQIDDGPSPEGTPVTVRRRKPGARPEAALSFAALVAAMTAETEAQFSAFRLLREKAQALVEAEGEEAAMRLARSDLKLAVDGMSLAIRSLEKLDSMARALRQAEDRSLEAHLAAQNYDSIRDRLVAFIEARARIMAEDMLAERLAEADRSHPSANAHGAEVDAEAGAGAGPDLADAATAPASTTPTMPGPNP